MTPEDALNVRRDNLKNIDQTVEDGILKTLDQIMRASPFGQVFETAGRKHEIAAAKYNGEIPSFQVFSLFLIAKNKKAMANLQKKNKKAETNFNFDF